MRTTVTLDPDVAAEVRRISREQGVGVSEALNQLVRRGTTTTKTRRRYVHRTTPIGLKVSIDDVASVLELLDER